MAIQKVSEYNGEVPMQGNMNNGHIREDKGGFKYLCSI